MSESITDRNLHYAIVALQMRLINRDQFVEAINEWTLDKSEALDRLMVDLGMLNSEDQSLLSQVVARHLDKFDGDVTQSLASIGSVPDLGETTALIEDRDVEASLAHLTEQTLDFTPSSKSATATERQSTTERQPTGRVGNRFKILRPHAKGGLGQVHVARDEEIGRQVALKEIQPQYSDNDTLRNRFVLEAEINGNLEHPGIVPVYGLGSFDDGRPYYAMRFIEGDSLREAISDFHRDSPTLDATARNLRLRQLLGRFIDVCDALAYAHSRGVLHRDLKPSNIMLGQYGETLIIDWGLAKHADQAERVSTEPNAPDMTLIPQSGSTTDATVAGRAIGTPAYMSPEQAEGNLEAFGPSTDVYGLGATLYALLTGRAPIEGDEMKQVIDRVRGGEIDPPRGIAPRIPRALEAICLKALALKPEDRYASARLLADDIEHFLADEPITARRDSLPTQVWRWIRKHRTLTTTAAATLLVGIIALSVGWTREARFADQLSNTNLQLRDSIAATKKAEQLAEARLDLAMNSIEDYFTGVSEEALMGGQVSDELRERLLKKPAEFYLKLTAELSSKSAPSEREQALLAKGQSDLGNLLRILGRSNDALEQTKASATSYQTLIKNQPENLDYQRELAESNNNLGVLLQTTGQYKAAIDAYQTSIELQESIVKQAPLAMDERDGLGQCLNNYGYLLQATGRVKEAIPVYERAIILRKKLIEEDPEKGKYRRGLAKSYLNMSNAFQATGKLNEAGANSDRAIVTFELLLEREPENPEFQDGLVACLGDRANIYSKTNRGVEALENLRRGIAISDSLVQRFPVVPKYMEDLAGMHNSLCNLLRGQSEFDAALEAIARSIALYESLVNDHPDVSDYRNALGAAWHNKGRVLQVQEKHEQAVECFYNAIAQQQQVFKIAPQNRRYRTFLGAHYQSLAQSLRSLGKAIEAADATRELIALWPNDPSELYNGACWLSLCLPLLPDGTPADQREALAAEAVATLKLAIQAGWSDANQISKDSDLDPVREREEFQRALSEIDDDEEKSAR